MAQAAEILLQHKADTAAKDVKGNAPLHYAAGYGKGGIVRMLVEAGADITAKNEAGQTAAAIIRRVLGGLGGRLCGGLGGRLFWAGSGFHLLHSFAAISNFGREEEKQRLCYERVAICQGGMAQDRECCTHVPLLFA